VKPEPVIPLDYRGTAPPVATLTTPPGVGLSAEQLQDLADARRRGAKVRRAISVAKFDAWTVAIFAGFTLLGVAFGSWVCAVLGIGMAVVSFVEFKGIERLRRLDPTVAKTLALNQVGLGLLLLTYAAYSMATAGSSLANELKGQPPEVMQMLGGAEGMEKAIIHLIYGLLAMVAIFGQGGTALFYLSRKRYIEEYASQTPQWIMDAMRAGLPM